MKTLIPIILQELRANRPAALATVLVSKGSAPRGAGACQLMTRDGLTFGTVGGGVLERRAMDEMALLLQTQPPSSSRNSETTPSAPAHWQPVAASASVTQEYALTQNDVQSLGMVCGGNVSLLYQLLTPDLLPLFVQMQAAVDDHKKVWMLRQFTGPFVTAIGFCNGEIDPSQVSAAAWFPLLGRKPEYRQSDEQHPGWFCEPVVLQSHAYLFGGGHVAQSAVPLLAQLDFAPVVYDDRPEFASQALFPTASQVICAPFSEAGHRLVITPDDEVVIMTRGHANDLVILTQALQTPAYYIGLIGSRSKIAYTRNLLLQAGFLDADFLRVRTPIGLPILAETPMEIAVSIAAEMIRCRAEHAIAADAVYPASSTVHRPSV